MKVSDYIVEYLINKKITDVFGYPGGMVTHLLDSFSKYENKISTHLNYHEQAAAFAACGYAQASNKVGVAYATSGPGATNLITGICQAYYDSIPVLFITGQVNQNECKKNRKIRQKGFQETDIVSMTKQITKYVKKVNDPYKIKYYLDSAFESMLERRKGPALLDIPMNIMKAEIDPNRIKGKEKKPNKKKEISFIKLEELLQNCKRPVLIIGNGFKNMKDKFQLEQKIIKSNIPLVTSMIAIDTLSEYKYNYGFIGAYGSRIANFIVSKSDLVIALGSRLDIRQVGINKKRFARNATIVRIDIDGEEVKEKIRKNDVIYNIDISSYENEISKVISNHKYDDWINTCEKIKNCLKDYDKSEINKTIEKISQKFSNKTIITTDVGQNQVWCAQSLKIKHGQKVLFSGSEGAMGYSLPAAIGAYYARKDNIVCFLGDGGMQMNIQELQCIAREKLPIKIFLINNNALGMIRHFQEMYFNNNYVHTTKESGYTNPNFSKIAKAYGIEYRKLNINKSINKKELENGYPYVFELNINYPTYVVPKLAFGSENQDQEPKIDREIYNYLNNL